MDPVPEFGIKRENEERRDGGCAVVYRAAQELGVPCFDNRPLEMWMGNAIVNDKFIPRFQKIDDPAVIAQLESIRARMYP